MQWWALLLLLLCTLVATGRTCKTREERAALEASLRAILHREPTIDPAALRALFTPEAIECACVHHRHLLSPSLCANAADAVDDPFERRLADVEPRFRDECRAVFFGEDGGFSQAKQDWFVFHNYVRHAPHFGSGVYVDVGANDPEYLSNTLFFDKCLGWSGLCIEMQPAYTKKLREQRSCTVVPTCVSRKPAAFQIRGSGTGAAIHAVAPGTPGAVTCQSLAHILRSHNVTRVHYMSVDIEGQELPTLGCFPFSEFDIDTLDVETNKDFEEARVLDFIMLHHGYTVDAHLANGGAGATTGQFLDTIYRRRAHPLASLPPAPLPMVALAPNYANAQPSVHRIQGLIARVKGDLKCGKGDDN